VLEVVVGFGRESGCARGKSVWFRRGAVNFGGLGGFWWLGCEGGRYCWGGGGPCCWFIDSGDMGIGGMMKNSLIPR